MLCDVCGAGPLQVIGNPKRGNGTDMRVRYCVECNAQFMCPETTAYVNHNGLWVEKREWEERYAEQVREDTMTALRLKHNCEKLDALEMFEEGSY
jgi:transcriptional regulator NrdR family protein